MAAVVAKNRKEAVRVSGSRGAAIRAENHKEPEIAKRRPSPDLESEGGTVEGADLIAANRGGMRPIHSLAHTEWSSEVRSITYSRDATSVPIAYRVTLYGSDAEIFREATGNASVSDTSYGGPVQKAEAMAFHGAYARLGLGLHLYHQDLE
ncbi:DNA repair RAD52-like protein 1, mitochondrial [Salvia miltiorrhiza]|uniref:DNA repair RAD52-like protein 1, mitochondrial n=1 Tax=Salvia miltiorrhiza TaxID=226208 RepID=UPI0025AD3C28|nr:DNA repair RAD52-like protein 1, mitochondrial [Salvia miltiorrhiza]